MKIRDLTSEVLALPIDARAALADKLVESLDPAEDILVREAWGREANRRLEELRSGEVKAIPGVEVSKSIRKKYRG